MYIYISTHNISFLIYLICIMFVSIILINVIDILGIPLLFMSLSSICMFLYLFRFYHALPAQFAVSNNIIVWPSDGIITSISNGVFFKLLGIIIQIDCGILNMYTHVSPIYGQILKIINIENSQQYGNGIYIQIINENYQVDLLICNENKQFTWRIPTLLVNENDYVYVSQPICISDFGATVYIVIDDIYHKYSWSKLHTNLITLPGAMIV